MKKIEIVPYRSSWETDFQVEKETIQMLLPEKVKIYHIGSTAIPNMFADPIIDLMMVVNSIKAFDNYSIALVTLGYESMGESCKGDRRFFIKCDDSCSFHLHIFEQGSPEVERHIAFREYMIAHTEQAMDYIKLKKELAIKHRENKEEYKKGRKKFIEEIDRKAKEWKK